jgi:hypothetical protein
LIDEYDAPVHAGYNYGYYDDVILFTRNFLCGGLKDMDQYLEKSVITGIMRIAKESIFSGLNKGVMAIKLGHSGGKWTADKVWENSDVSFYMSTPVLSGDRLFGLSRSSSGGVGRWRGLPFYC